MKTLAQNGAESGSAPGRRSMLQDKEGAKLISSKSVLRKINELGHRLSSTERKIASYIVSHPFETIRSSTEQLANASHVSQASIIRFCQKLGYSGFKDLKISLAQEVGSLVPKVIVEPNRAGDFDFVAEVLQQSIEGMKRTVATLKREMLDAAIRAIAHARLVDIYGVGESYVVGEHLHIKLRRLGIVANIYSNPHLQAISAASLKPGDVAIGISFSGCTLDTIEAIGFASKSGATTIAITNFPEFPLAQKADILLETNAVEALFPYGSISSRIAQLFIVDLIFAGLLVNYKDKYRKAYEYYNEIIQTKL